MSVRICLNILLYYPLHIYKQRYEKISLESSTSSQTNLLVENSALVFLLAAGVPLMEETLLMPYGFITDITMMVNKRLTFYTKCSKN